MADKYTQSDIDALGKKGQAFGPDDDGHYSYPIADEADLKAAIRAVGRGNADHDKIRAFIIKRAKALDASDLIPDNWNSDGSLSDAEEKGHVWTAEQRDTANDVFAALSGVITDAYDNVWSAWVQDWYGDGEDQPYTVVYYYAGDIWAATFTVDDAGKYLVNTAAARKVRPSTTYVDRSAPKRESRALTWRRARADGLRGLERRVAVERVELREASDGTLAFTGYASLSETPYDMGWYTETVARGAAKKTLSENPDVVLTIDHGLGGSGLPIARTKAGNLRLSEDGTGLKVDADLDPEDPDVELVNRKYKNGNLDGQMSFAFSPTRQEWNEDYTQRRIVEYNLHRGDVSIVTQGASPTTSSSIRTDNAVTALRHLGGQGVAEGLWDWFTYRSLPREQRVGKTHSNATVEVLTHVLNLCAIADEAMDEAQPVLAELLGVDNPDEDDSAPSGDDDTASSDDSAAADDDERSVSVALEMRHRLEALRHQRRNS